MSIRTGPRWSKQEEATLQQLVQCHGTSKAAWSLIARDFETSVRSHGTPEASRRTAQMCENRWNQVIDAGIARGPWMEDEDRVLIDCMNQGITKWSDVSVKIPGRGSKQCRERWQNHLDPNLKKTLWTAEEDWQLGNLHKEIGNSWKKIAARMTGRSENEVKNRKNSAAHKREIGIGNMTHTSNPLSSQSFYHKVPTKKSKRAVSRKHVSDNDDDEEDDYNMHNEEGGLSSTIKRQRLCNIATMSGEGSDRDSSSKTRIADSRLYLPTHDGGFPTDILNHDDFISLKFAEMMLESYRAEYGADNRASPPGYYWRELKIDSRGPALLAQNCSSVNMPSPTASIQWAEFSRHSPMTIDYSRLEDMGFFSGSLGTPDLSRTTSPFPTIGQVTPSSLFDSDMRGTPTPTGVAGATFLPVARILAKIELMAENDSFAPHVDRRENTYTDDLENITSLVGLGRNLHNNARSSHYATKTTASYSRSSSDSDFASSPI